MIHSPSAPRPRTPTPFELLHGSPFAPVEPRLLTAGPVTALLDGPDLRSVKIGGLEVVRRLHVAVRDANWNTIPAELRKITVEAERDRFTVQFEVGHQLDPVDFTWQGEITGQADGTIRFAMSGQAHGNFRFNRIGFCLLHPPVECSGKKYQASNRDGKSSQGELPDLIAPQRLENGQYGALFPPFDSLAVDLTDQLTAHFSFEGDLFEMEDQRNWTDASFKTYCTPLSRPFPFSARPAFKVAQAVTCSFSGSIPKRAEASEPVVVTLGQSLGRKLPKLGLGLASHGPLLSTREAALLRALKLDHLRVDLRLAKPDWIERWQEASAQGSLLECALELAVFVSAEANHQLTELVRHLPASPPVARVLVFHEQEECTGESWLHLARKLIAPEIPVAGGTNIYFCELNRNRSNGTGADAIAYSINPQVHAGDDLSVMENALAQADTVRTAHAFADGKPIFVTPVTLRRRFNASATEPERVADANELPSQVDPRQMSLFGAAWTIASIKQLTESGAAAVTYFETTGWLGVIERDGGSPLHAQFPSEPAAVFPIFHVLADLGEFKTGEVMSCESTQPLVVQALALRAGSGEIILVANLTAQALKVSVTGLPAKRVTVRSLDSSSALFAMREPTQFRASGNTRQITGKSFQLELPPYATVRLTLAD